MNVLVINAGSSSLKFALVHHTTEAGSETRAEGVVELLFRDPSAPPVKHLMDLDQSEYDRRGGNVPLHEFFTPSDIYRHFA